MGAGRPPCPLRRPGVTMVENGGVGERSGDGAGSGPGCQILDLTLGPLNLNLLGLVVTLNQVHSNITAVRGPGNLGRGLPRPASREPLGCNSVPPLLTCAQRRRLRLPLRSGRFRRGRHARRRLDRGANRADDPQHRCVARGGRLRDRRRRLVPRASRRPRRLRAVQPRLRSGLPRAPPGANDGRRAARERDARRDHRRRAQASVTNRPPSSKQGGLLEVSRAGARSPSSDRGSARAPRLLSGTPASAPPAARWRSTLHANARLRECTDAKEGDSPANPPVFAPGTAANFTVQAAL
jgi:hypothetical protein